MKNDDNNKSNDIELVSIEDLRTAFGGAAGAGPVPTATPGPATGPINPIDPGKTVMCSGWSSGIPMPGSQY